MQESVHKHIYMCYRMHLYCCIDKNLLKIILKKFFLSLLKYLGHYYNTDVRKGVLEEKY